MKNSESSLQGLQTFTENEGKLLDLVKDFAKLGKQTGEKYREIVKFVIDHKIEPDRVSMVMEAAGLIPKQVSELKKIAFADAPTQKAYVGGALTFRVALDLARDASNKKTGKKRKKIAKSSKALAGLTAAFEEYVNEKPEFKAFAREHRGRVMVLLPENYEGTAETPGGVVISVKITPRKITAK